jgi:hypothetical protein
VDSVNVIITDNPEGLNFTGWRAGRRIGWPRMLGVPRTSLMRLAAAVENETRGGRWVAMGGRFADEDRSDAPIEWNVIFTAKDLRAQWLVAIHPRYCSYDAEVGLMLGQAGAAPEVVYDELPPLPRYSYEFETWQDHARRVVDQSRLLLESNRRARAAIADWCQRMFGKNVPEEGVARWVELTGALHDFGKLAAKWQETAWAWQRDKDTRLRTAGQAVPQLPQVALAHTAYDAATDGVLRNRREYVFPPHAVEGAYALGGVVTEALMKATGPDLGRRVAQAILSAIARHHGARASTLRPYEMTQEAELAMREWIPEASGAGLMPSPKNETSIRDVLARFGDDQLWPICTLLMRFLRLADQGSFDRKQR